MTDPISALSITLGILVFIVLAMLGVFWMGKREAKHEQEARNAAILQRQMDVAVPTDSASIDDELRKL